jgi:hypothetical protein
MGVLLPHLLPKDEAVVSHEDTKSEGWPEVSVEQDVGKTAALLQNKLMYPRVEQCEDECCCSLGPG